MQTLMLYDPGEEEWGTKLHLGCGGIYLHGYVNIDIAGTRTEPGFFPVANQTTVKDYYFDLQGTATHLPKRRETVVDQHADICYLPYTPETVHKILAIQVFEHLTPAKAWAALTHWRRLLVPGGVLVLTVPDMVGTLDWLENSPRISGGGLDTVDGWERFQFCLRHLRGSARDQYNHHKAWYTADGLQELLETHSFTAAPIPNPHIYPALAFRAVKHA